LKGRYSVHASAFPSALCRDGVLPVHPDYNDQQLIQILYEHNQKVKQRLIEERNREREEDGVLLSPNPEDKNGTSPRLLEGQPLNSPTDRPLSPTGEPRGAFSTTPRSDMDARLEPKSDSPKVGSPRLQLIKRASEPPRDPFGDICSIPVSSSKSSLCSGAIITFRPSSPPWNTSISHYSIVVGSRCHIFCVGSAVGRTPVRNCYSSRLACASAVNYLCTQEQTLKTPKAIAIELLNTMEKAHSQLVDLQAAPTKLMCGILVPSTEVKHNRKVWALLRSQVGVGVTLIIDVERTSVSDVTHVGPNVLMGKSGRPHKVRVPHVQIPDEGSIGPTQYIDRPNLCDLQLCYAECLEGSIVVALNSTILAMLDPSTLGISPCQVAALFPNSEGVSGQWNQIGFDKEMELKRAYRLAQLKKVIFSGSGPVTPDSVVRSISSYCSQFKQRDLQNLALIALQASTPSDKK